MVLGMGFNMKTLNIRLVGFSVLHILGAICIPLLIFLLTSCIHKEEEKADDGPEVSANDIQSAFDKAANKKTLANSKKGDWVLIESTQQIFTEPPQFSGLLSKQIYSMTQNSNIYDLEILKRVYDISQSPPVVSNESIEKCQVYTDGSDHSCRYSPMRVSQKAAGPDLSKANYSQFSSTHQLQPRGNSTSYHNLIVSQSAIRPPKLVSDKASCGGVPNCLLNITTIQFDETTYVDGERTRYRHEMDFSGDAPFLAIVLRHCIKWNYKTENRYLPAELCDRAVNFEYGL